MENGIDPGQEIKTPFNAMQFAARPFFNGETTPTLDISEYEDDDDIPGGKTIVVDDNDKTNSKNDPKEDTSLENSLPGDDTKTDPKDDAKPDSTPKSDPVKEVKLTGKESTGYLFAQSFIADGSLPDDITVKPDASMSEVRDLTKETWKKELFEEVDSILENRGFTPEIKQYIDYIREGGDPSRVKEFSDNKKLEELDIAGEDDTSLNNRKTIIMRAYELKGITGKKAENLYRIALDSKEDFEEAVEGLKEIQAKDQEEMALQSKADEAAKAKQAEKIKEIQTKIVSIIDKGTIGNITLDTKQKADLKSYVYDETEIMKVKDEKGNPKNIKISAYKKDLAAYQGNLEQQIMFAYLLKNNFSLEGIYKKAKVDAENQFINKLEASVTRVARGYEDTNNNDTPVQKSNVLEFNARPRSY